MEENRQQHLNFIQSVLTRRNTNSSKLNITIVSALLAIYASNNNVIFIFIGFFPTIIFWFLDACYLQQERKFGDVYNDVVGITSNFSIQDYEMPIPIYKGGKFSTVVGNRKKMNSIISSEKTSLKCRKNFLISTIS